jgi:hypothetical protein
MESYFNVTNSSVRDNIQSIPANNIGSQFDIIPLHLTKVARKVHHQHLAAIRKNGVDPAVMSRLMKIEPIRNDRKQSRHNNLSKYRPVANYPVSILLIIRIM